MQKFEKKKLVVLSTVAAVGLSATQIVVKSDELASPQQPTVSQGTVVAPEAPPVRVANTNSRRDRNG